MAGILNFYDYNDASNPIVSLKEQQENIDKAQDEKINEVNSDMEKSVQDAIVNVMIPYLEWMSQQFYTKEECDQKFQTK